MSKDGKSYSASDIQVLEGLEPVRKRPGMYIGTTGLEGLHHLIWEIFDNSRDEAMGGYADSIEVALLPNNRIRIADNGRGIPVDKHPKTKVSALETIMTVLHAGGKFGGEDSGYKVSGGLHGVGVSVVNALSTYTRAEVHRDGGKYVQEYARGKKKEDVKKIGKSDYRGTIVTFDADPEIFPEIAYDWKKIVQRLRQQAYLVKKLRITIIDARAFIGKMDWNSVFWISDLKVVCPSVGFYFEGGLESFVRFQNRNEKTIHSNVFYIDKSIENVQVEIAFQYVDDMSNTIMPFANNIYNSEGGTHITGFKTALTRGLNNYARSANLLKEKDDNFSGDDVLEGITAVVSVKLPEIQFEGQTKSKLGSVEARGAVDSAFSEALSEYLEEHPEDGKAIINKVILALRARKAAKAAKDSVLRKGALEGMALPGKLADCNSRKAEDSELFVVEGDSAGGSAKQGRDNKTQAILPLRGKILNVERARLDKMLASEQIKNLVIAMGTAIGDVFDISKLRYHKIIIATDADVDGAHIRTLILTLMFRYFRQLIDGGYIYIAQPPLYKVIKGKEQLYFYDDSALDAYFKKEGVDESVLEIGHEDMDDNIVLSDNRDTSEKGATKPGKKIRVQRYKGLGEMNPEELWETTMDPTRRVLKQVTVEDAQEADRVIDTLMGTDVSSRKSFIQSNAKMANIDV